MAASDPFIDLPLGMPVRRIYRSLPKTTDALRLRIEGLERPSALEGIDLGHSKLDMPRHNSSVEKGGRRAVLVYIFRWNHILPFRLRGQLKRLPVRR